MCFSEDVSWLTLAASWSGCAALAATGQPHWQAMAGFLALVGGMQLWEALLWRNSRWCTPANGHLSSAGAVNNHLEPLALYAMCRWLLAPRSPLRADLAGAVIAVYALVFGALTLGFVRRPLSERCTRVAPSGRGSGLAWQWNEHGGRHATMAAYGLFVLAFVTTIYAYLPAGVDHAMAAVTVASLGASLAVYGSQGMVGRMWCLFAALLPWLILSCA
jgi:hypothetical protein